MGVFKGIFKAIGRGIKTLYRERPVVGAMLTPFILCPIACAITSIYAARYNSQTKPKEVVQEYMRSDTYIEIVSKELTNAEEKYNQGFMTLTHFNEVKTDIQSFAHASDLFSLCATSEAIAEYNIATSNQEIGNTLTDTAVGLGVLSVLPGIAGDAILGMYIADEMPYALREEKSKSEEKKSKEKI